MRILRSILAPVLAGLVCLGIFSGCSSHDPVVLVTPYVAKAPQPPPAASQPAASPGLLPATSTYEQAVIGK